MLAGFGLAGDGGAADRAEAAAQDGAAIGGAGVFRELTGEADILGAEADIDGGAARTEFLAQAAPAGANNNGLTACGIADGATETATG